MMLAVVLALLAPTTRNGGGVAASYDLTPRWSAEAAVALEHHRDFVYTQYVGIRPLYTLVDYWERRMTTFPWSARS